MIFKKQSVGVGPIAAALAMMIIAGTCGCSMCSNDSTWSSEKALDQIGRVVDWNQPLHDFADTKNNSTYAKQSAGEPALSNLTAARSDAAKKILVPIDEVSSSDVLMDISENATEHIKNSIAISYVQFLHNGNLKPMKDISKILGGAGISPQDSVVIYGECMPCGGGPAPATLVYWMMRSMGHENVRVLDGTAEDWIAAGKIADNDTVKRSPTNYTARFTDRFIATYDYVKSGEPQIVDARSFQEFGAGSLPGAINIPYNSIIERGKIAEEVKLQKIFAILDKNRPVVVFTAQPTKGSSAWFALELLGYDAKLYSYEDWQYNQKARSARGNETLNK
jgi:thiosulfate/3-mercaptopyruvate sulfurtransferase